jgi:hypothetical protein
MLTTNTVCFKSFLFLLFHFFPENQVRQSWCLGREIHSWNREPEKKWAGQKDETSRRRSGLLLLNA